MIYDTENPVTLKCHIARQEREIADLQWRLDQRQDDLQTARGIACGLAGGLLMWAIIALASCS